MKIKPNTVLFYPHHDEPSVPQGVFVTVKEQMLETSPQWVLAKARLKNQVVEGMFRGSEGREVGVGSQLTLNLRNGFTPHLHTLKKHPATISCGHNELVWDLQLGQPCEILPPRLLASAELQVAKPVPEV